ncbi:hypothetical protein SGPA1_21484 [Streptomyces misionensis JCM 4497]
MRTPARQGTDGQSPGVAGSVRDARAENWCEWVLSVQVYLGGTRVSQPASGAMTSMFAG